MSKIRGKKVNATQRNLLIDNGYEDTENWIYVKTQTIGEGETKKVSKNGSKTICQVFHNRATGEEISLEI